MSCNCDFVYETWTCRKEKVYASRQAEEKEDAHMCPCGKLVVSRTHRVGTRRIRGDGDNRQM